MTITSIALCGIVRNEIRGLVEWLAHYKALGFTDFVIYDNESTDGTDKVLQALDEAGELIRIEWPHTVGVNPQILAYDHMRKSSTVDWIAFFDADEFLLLRQDTSIGDFLQRFGADVSAIAVNWVPFNSGGQDRFRAAPVIERFIESLPPSAHYCHIVKCIGRRVALKGHHIHSAFLRRGRYVTPSGMDAVFRSRTKTETPDIEVAALHHYMVKSLEEFEEKRMRGHANSHNSDRKRTKLDDRLQASNAPGTRNTDLLAWSGRMRAEAMRLRGILLDAGLSYPVWPFVEADT
ncbi:MAG: glycosyltransferase family 92 protein [Tabrizicola sp.]